MKASYNLYQANSAKWRLLFDHLAGSEHQFLRGIRDSRKAESMWGMMRGVGGIGKSIHQSWLAKELGLGLLCWGFKGVQVEIRLEEASALQIGSVAFPPGKCTSLQHHPSHRLFEQDGHQDSSSASLLCRPCSLWLLVIPYVQKLSLWDNWGDERGCDEGHWHAYTRGLETYLMILVLLHPIEYSYFIHFFKSRNKWFSYLFIYYFELFNECIYITLFFFLFCHFLWGVF